MRIFLAIIFFGTIGWFNFRIWENNKPVEYPSKTAIENSLTRGIEWIDVHRSEVLSEENPMLWWMLKSSADLTGNQVITELYNEYKTRYLNPGLHNVWSHLFLEDSKAPVVLSLLNQLPRYNLLFLYGSTCNEILGQVSEVKEQLSPSFCDSHLLTPACVTHQLMGFRFLQKRQCGNPKDISTAISLLQDRLVTQLSWDFRLVDVYIQRVMMLVDTSARERVKPVWIKRVLSAQESDGGWSGFEPLFHLSKDTSAGFSARVISIDRNQSNFHATAQGVLLMSLLLTESTH